MSNDSYNQLFAGRAVGGPYDGLFLSTETGPVLHKQYPFILSFDSLILDMAMDATATVKFATYKWDYIRRAFIFQPDKSDESPEGKAAIEGEHEASKP